MADATPTTRRPRAAEQPVSGNGPGLVAGGANATGVQRDPEGAVCAGIGCSKSRPDPGQDRAATGDETHRGWIELRVDGVRRRFCSWSCLVSFANDRLQVTVGD